MFQRMFELFLLELQKYSYRIFCNVCGLIQKSEKDVSIEIFLPWPLSEIMMPAYKESLKASELRSMVEVDRNVYDYVARNKYSAKSAHSQQIPCYKCARRKCLAVISRFEIVDWQI